MTDEFSGKMKRLLYCQRKRPHMRSGRLAGRLSPRSRARLAGGDVPRRAQLFVNAGTLDGKWS